jgi:hypothetical protein
MDIKTIIRTQFVGIYIIFLHINFVFSDTKNKLRQVKPCQSQWLRDLRRGSAAASLLRLWVRIPPGAWMSVFGECCVSLGRVLCGELITHPEESYRLWCVVLRDLEIS